MKSFLKVAIVLLGSTAIVASAIETGQATQDLAAATAADAAAETSLASARLDATEALAAAANKPVTEAVIAQVNANLGITASPDLVSGLAEAVEEARTASTGTPLTTR